MIKRNVQAQVEAAFDQNRVVGLAGVRGGGKSTFARSIAEAADGSAIFLDLERAEDVAKLAGAEQFLRAVDAPLVVLDEVDRCPEMPALIWRLIDGRRYRGSFLLTTSVTPARMVAGPSVRKGADAGPLIDGLRRTTWIQVPALTVGEVPVSRHEEMWLRGCLPDSLLADTDDASLEARRNWLDDLLERRLRRLAGRVPPDRLRLMLSMLARVQGEILNASRLARGLGVSVPTVMRWLKLAKALFLLREVPALDLETGKRLIKTPRMYLRDVGILNLLLGIENRMDLVASPWVAAGWEGWMLGQFIDSLGTDCRLGHYRTRSGGSVDLAVVGADGEIRRIVDFRYGGGGSRGFTLAAADLGIEEGRRSVISPGSGLIWGDFMQK